MSTFINTIFIEYIINKDIDVKNPTDKENELLLDKILNHFRQCNECCIFSLEKISNNYIIIYECNNPNDYDIDIPLKGTNYRVISPLVECELKNNDLKLAFENPLLFCVVKDDIQYYVNGYPDYFESLKTNYPSLYNYLLS